MQYSDIRKHIKSYYFNSRLQINKLPLGEQEYLKKHSFEISIERKKTLIKQGESANGVYFIKKGSMKAFQTNLDNTIQILFFFKEGDYFGFRPLINQEIQTTSFAAIEDCKLIFIEGKRFLQVMKNSIQLLNQMVTILSREYAVLSNRINMYARRNINERLALAILILSEKLYSGEFANRKIHFTITRTDLANFVGTSLENIVRSLKTFADSGMVRTDGKTIYVQDYERIFASSGISRSHLH